jgi:hypothetical protein
MRLLQQTDEKAIIHKLQLAVNQGFAQAAIQILADGEVFCGLSQF